MSREFFHILCRHCYIYSRLETMASHRAQLLSTLLPNALAFGFQEIHPEREPLKVAHKPVRYPVCLNLMLFPEPGHRRACRIT